MVFYTFMISNFLNTFNKIDIIKTIVDHKILGYNRFTISYLIIHVRYYFHIKLCTLDIYCLQLVIVIIELF